MIQSFGVCSSVAGTAGWIGGILGGYGRQRQGVDVEDLQKARSCDLASEYLERLLISSSETFHFSVSVSTTVGSVANLPKVLENKLKER